MKKSIKILVISLCISSFLFLCKINVSFARIGVNTNGIEKLKGLFDSLKGQYLMAHTNPLEDADTLISYANHLYGRDAILMWDDAFDNDGIVGNNFSKNRMLADGNYILFQKEKDANDRNDILILLNINEFAVEKIADREEVFNILDEMDKSKNDGILQDSFDQSVIKDKFLGNSKIRILLKNDKFQIVGGDYSGKKEDGNIACIGTELDLKGVKNLIEVLSSVKNQYFMSDHKPLNNADELITYANYLCRGDAILIWDNVLDHDGILGNTLSEDNYYAVGRYILFQTKVDAACKNDTFIIIDINEPSVKKITDRSDVFNILTKMDNGIKNDEVQDTFNQTVSRSKFMGNTRIKIILRKDRFQINGGSDPNGKKVNVNKVILDEKSISLKQGEKYQLVAIVMPYDASVQQVKWSSDNSAIASVDSTGNIRAKKVGTTNIKVSTVDGNKTFRCKVTVKKNPNYYIVGQTASLYCAKQFEQIYWTSNNTDVVEIIDRYGQTCGIKCLKEGTATVIVQGDSYKYYYDSEYKLVCRKLVREDFVHLEIIVTRKD